MCINYWLVPSKKHVKYWLSRAKKCIKYFKKYVLNIDCYCQYLPWVKKNKGIKDSWSKKKNTPNTLMNENKYQLLHWVNKKPITVQNKKSSITFPIKKTVHCPE